MPSADHVVHGPPPLPRAPTGWRAGLRIQLWRWRVPLAVTLGALALAGFAQELRPAPAGTVQITVSAHPLRAGATLARTDLARVDVPAAAAPSGARADPASLVGRTAAIDLPAGVPLVDALLGSALHGPAGTVVAVVQLTDTRTAGLVRAGDHVDLLAPSTDTGPGREVAHRALVVPAASRSSGSTPMCSVTGNDTDGASLVVAVTPDEALALSQVSGSAGLVAVLVP